LLAVGLIVGSILPAVGSSTKPIAALYCQTPSGYRYSRIVSSWSSTVTCRYGDAMIGIRFGYY
jgi:hypothetical protein